MVDEERKTGPGWLALVVAVVIGSVVAAVLAIGISVAIDDDSDGGDDETPAEVVDPAEEPDDAPDDAGAATPGDVQAILAEVENGIVAVQTRDAGAGGRIAGAGRVS